MIQMKHTSWLRTTWKKSLQYTWGSGKFVALYTYESLSDLDIKICFSLDHHWYDINCSMAHMVHRYWFRLHYFYHWLYTSSGGLIVPDGHINPVLNFVVLTRSTDIVWLKFCIIKFWKLTKMKEKISLMQSSDSLHGFGYTLDHWWFDSLFSICIRFCISKCVYRESK